MDTFTRKNVIFNNSSINIMLNHENPYLYENKNMIFGCDWEALIETQFDKMQEMQGFG